MFKKTITYYDYDGNEITEDFYFNFTKAELHEMNYSETGGMQNLLQKIIATRDTKRLVELFKKIILDSYGEKSLDGKRFVKSEELSRAFSQTEAYSQLYMELVSDDQAASTFINGIIPADVATEVSKEKTNKSNLTIAE